MKLKCLDGTEVKIEVRPSEHKDAFRSKIQTEVGKRLKELYPRHIILEEFLIPKTKMRLDFFIPRLSLAYEVQGKQHDEFVEYFHGTMEGFKNQKKRDKNKQEWCDLNNIMLVEIRSIEDLNED